MRHRKSFWLAVLASKMGEDFDTVLGIAFVHSVNISILTEENILDHYITWLESKL